MNRESFKKTRDVTIWTTREGTRMKIKQMEHSHLQNTILLLMKKQDECSQASLGTYLVNGRPAVEWCQVLKDELDYRNSNTIPSIKVLPENKVAVML